MAIDDADRWNARYARRSGDVVPEPPGALVPPPGDPLAEAILRSVVSGLVAGASAAAITTRAVALDVACGLGAQTVWAARAGMHVTALDASKVAIDAVRRLAAAHAVSERVDARVHDLDEGVPPWLPDAVDLVCCQRFRMPSLYDALFDVLRPAADGAHGGGVAVITVLSEVGAAEPGPYHAPAGELTSAVRRRDDLDLLRSTEARGEASIVVRRR